MKVALLQPAGFDSTFPPYELAQLAGCVRQYGHEPEAVDLGAASASGGPDAVERELARLASSGPRVAVLHVTPSSLPRGLEAAGRLRRLGVPLIALSGGVFRHAEAMRSVLLCRAVDIVIQGVGDHTLPLLLRDLRGGGMPSHEPGLYFKSEGGRRVEQSSRDEPLRTVDDLPFADFAALAPGPYRNPTGLRLRVHRGCPCRGIVAMGGRRIYLEISYHRRVRPETGFFWIDDFFGAMPTDELASLGSLLSRFQATDDRAGVAWGLHTAWRPGLTPDLARALAAAGARRFALNVLSGVGRAPVDRAGLDRWAAAAREAGASVSVHVFGDGRSAGGAASTLDRVYPPLEYETVCWWRLAGRPGAEADRAPARVLPGDEEAGLVPASRLSLRLLSYRQEDRPFQAVRTFLEDAEASASSEETSLLADYAADLRRLLSVVDHLDAVRRIGRTLEDPAAEAKTFRRLSDWFDNADRSVCATHRRNTVIQPKGTGIEQARSHQLQRMERHLVCAQWRLSQIRTHWPRLRWDDAEGRVRAAWGRDESVDEAEAVPLLYAYEERFSRAGKGVWLQDLASSGVFRRAAMSTRTGEFRHLADAREARASGDALSEAEALLDFLSHLPGDREAAADLARCVRGLAWAQSARRLLERADREAREIGDGGASAAWELVRSSIVEADRGACYRHRRSTGLMPPSDPFHRSQRLMRWLTCAQWRLSLARSSARLAREAAGGRFVIQAAGRVWEGASLEGVLARAAKVLRRPVGSRSREVAHAV
jgi:hypothetical protein